MRRRRAALGLSLFVLLGACDIGAPDERLPPRGPLVSPTGGDSRVIGLVGTQSGPNAWRGEDAFEGADVGVQWLNRQLDDGEVRFELFSLDDEGDPDKALSLVRRLTRDERTVGIVYAGPPEALPRAERALARAKIPALICYGDLYGARQLSAHTFQMAPPYLWSARVLARYVDIDRRYEVTGALVEETRNGQAARKGIQTAWSERGQRVLTHPYDTGTTAFTSHLRRMKRAGVEALLVQGSPGVHAAVTRGLADMGALYGNTAGARISSAAPKVTRRRRKNGWWHPQLMGFDQASFPEPRRVLRPGTVAADTYARGEHYLPIPSFEGFRAAFIDWWAARPTGLEHRAYEATLMLGWAIGQQGSGRDLARVLERLRERRFGGLDVTFGPDDHTSVGVTTVGLWVVPSREAAVRERDRLPKGLPWVPLARGFSIDLEETDILARDWKFMFVRPPPPTAPAPKIRKSKWGISTSRRDPIH